MFSCEFCEIFKNTFFTEHLRATASGTWDKLSKALFLERKSWERWSIYVCIYKKVVTQTSAYSKPQESLSLFKADWQERDTSAGNQ